MVAVGVSIPWGLWSLSPDEQRRLLGRIADAGIDHVFTADQVSFRDGSGMDGLVTLASLSGLEPRLGLHVGVLLLALRHPMVAARQIATLAEAAPGRLVVGVGAGGDDRHEVEVCDVDPGTRGRRTDAALEIVRALLAGETVDRMSFEPFERYTPCGTAADMAAFLQPYVDAGARTLNLTPCGPDREAEFQTVADVKRLLNA